MRFHPSLPIRQRGTTLLISLVFLVILTLFAVSGMNTGVINLRTANNAQMMIEAEFVAEQQIEQWLSSAANFKAVSSLPATATTNVDVNGDGYTDFTVVTQRPRCVNVRELRSEFSDEVIKAGSAPREHVYEVIALTTDSVFGTSATLREGVRIRLAPNITCVPS